MGRGQNSSLGMGGADLKDGVFLGHVHDVDRERQEGEVRRVIVVVRCRQDTTVPPNPRDQTPSQRPHLAFRWTSQDDGFLFKATNALNKDKNDEERV